MRKKTKQNFKISLIYSKKVRKIRKKLNCRCEPLYYIPIPIPVYPCHGYGLTVGLKIVTHTRTRCDLYCQGTPDSLPLASSISLLSPRPPSDSLPSSLPHPYLLILLPFLSLSLVYLSPCSPTHPRPSRSPWTPSHPIATHRSRLRLIDPDRDSPISIATHRSRSRPSQISRSSLQLTIFDRTHVDLVVLWHLPSGLCIL